MIAAAIKHLTLFPFLSMNMPTKGMRNDDIKNGKAIAIPT